MTGFTGCYKTAVFVTFIIDTNVKNLPFYNSWYQMTRSALFGFVTKHACDRRTNRSTNGLNYDSQDRASIVASRGKNGCSAELC